MKPMKTLEEYVKTLNLNHSVVSENERYDLARFGMSAFFTLPPHKQLDLTMMYCDIYKAPAQPAAETADPYEVGQVKYQFIQIMCADKQFNYGDYRTAANHFPKLAAICEKLTHEERLYLLNKVEAQL